MLPATGPTNSGPKNVVIMGCGRIGASIADSLAEVGHTVHVIDRDAMAFDLLSPGLVGTGRIVPIVGDGTREQDLRKASAQDADMFIAMTGKDPCNALGAQIAKHILQVSKVICRMSDPTRTEMYGELDLITISATRPVTDMVIRAAGG